MQTHHLNDLEKSGISNASIEKYGFKSISKEEASEKLGFPSPSAGWVIQYPKSPFLKVKPDNPINPKVKYLSPRGMSQDLFVTHLAQEVITKADNPFYFVEGEKKAIAMEQYGYASISVPGVWGFRSRGHTIETLNQINISTRVCYIIFDSDKYQNEHVRKAEKAFADVLIELGARVKIVNLTPENGKGADDQLMKLGKPSFQHFIDNAQDYSSSDDELKAQCGFGCIPLGQVQAQPLDWLVQDLLLSEGLAIISGKPKSGKSMIALKLLNCLTLGEDFLGFYKTKKVRCLAFSLEDNKHETKLRCQKMTKDGSISEDLLISIADSIKLPRDFDRIAIDIEQYKAKVLVIDTLRRSHTSEENSSTDMAPILRGVRDLIRKFNILVILIHHAGHRIERLDDPGGWLRGTSDLNGSWETLIGVNKHSSNTDLHVFHKYHQEFKVALKTSFGETILLELDDTELQTQKEDENKLLALLTKEDHSGNHLQKASKINRSRVDEALNRMASKGIIGKKGAGNRQKWTLLRFEEKKHEETHSVLNAKNTKEHEELYSTTSSC